MNFILPAAAFLRDTHQIAMLDKPFHFSYTFF